MLGYLEGQEKNNILREIMRSALVFKLLLSVGNEEQIKPQGAQCHLHSSCHSGP